MTRIAVVGSRVFGSRGLVDNWIGQAPTDTTIITGGSNGVDSWAKYAADRRGLPTLVIPPDWDKYPSYTYGKDYAPKKRNMEIARTCDSMVAFWDGRSTGTAHVVCCAVMLGKPVTVHMEEK